MYQEFFIKVKDATIMGYLWAVEDPKKIVLIIHGIGEHGGLYNRMAETLNANNFTAVTIDMRGHGCTTGTRGHTAPRKSVLSDVDKLIKITRKNYPDKPIILLGHSMGGNIVLDYRNRGKQNDEISAYIACSPWLMLKRSFVSKLTGPLNFISKINPKLQLSAGIKPKHLGNPHIISMRLNKSLGHNLITLQTAADNFNIGQAILNGTAEIKENHGREKPMLLMHGSNDQICDVKASRKLAKLEGKNCEYVEWEGYYHELHNGCSDKDGMETIHHIVDWVKMG